MKSGKRFVTSTGCAALVVALADLLGCAQSPAAPDSPSATTAKLIRPQETWDIYLLQGTRMGFGHTTVRLTREAGREVLRTESANHLTIRRGKETIRQEIRGVSFETPDGKLLSFETEIGMGNKPIRTNGRVKGDRLEIETSGEGVAAKTSIPWSADYGGPFAVEESLLKKPMRPGDRRTIKMIEEQQLAEVEMTARDFEPAKLQGATKDLLRIETVTRLPGNQTMEQTLWTDRMGDILKRHMPLLGGLETVRVTQAEALKETGAAAFDLLPSMNVEIDPPLADAHRKQEIRYRIHLDGGDPSKVFVVGPSQAVKPLDANTAEVTVYAIRPGQADGNRNAPPDPPTDDDRRPNVWVQSDDPLIVADAKKAAGDEKDPWRTAMALERFVNRDVNKKDFSQAFASASEVARSHEGDCTEHAVFLMALCRARGIPARAAIGLVYIDRDQAFEYHMWAEAYIDNRWIPIDATRAQGGIGAAHLKIAQSNLKEATGYSAFLPVVQVIGRLSIKVESAK